MCSRKQIREKYVGLDKHRTIIVGKMLASIVSQQILASEENQVVFGGLHLLASHESSTPPSLITHMLNFHSVRTKAEIHDQRFRFAVR